MREIKFRAWDGHTMQSSVGIYPLDGSLRFGTSDGHMFYRPNEVEIMQYTGLKDKNGVEIYEGDVVKYNTGEIWFVEWDVKQAGFIYMNRQVVDGSGRKKPSGMGYGQLPGSHEVEVIGNIWETPELLEKTS